MIEFPFKDEHAEIFGTPNDVFSIEQPSSLVDEEILKKIAENEAIPKLTYGKILQGKQPRKSPLNSPYLKNSSCGKEPDFQDLTALFDACFHTTESHEEILKRIVTIQKAWYPDEDSSQFGISFQFLFANLLTIHESLKSTYASGMKKIYWSERAEKLLIPQLMEADDPQIAEHLIFEPLAGEIVKTGDPEDINSFEQQVLYLGITPNELQAFFNNLFIKIYGDDFSHQLKNALEDEGHTKALKIWDYASEVHSDYKSCVLDHLILQMNKSDNTIPSKSFKEKVNIIKEILLEAK